MVQIDTPTTSNYPAIDCGIEPYEGLLVAYLPQLPASLMEEYAAEDGGVGYAVDGTLLDIVPLGKPRMPWWKVRNLARQYRLNIVEPIWTGPAGEFMLSLLPQVPRPIGSWLGMRAFTRGPWIKLEEKEKEETQDGRNADGNDATD